MKANDLRPPKKWFYHCVERVMNENGVDEDTARKLCGWIFYHQMKTKRPSESEPDDPRTVGARRRKQVWLNERDKKKN